MINSDVLKEDQARASLSEEQIRSLTPNQKKKRRKRLAKLGKRASACQVSATHEADDNNPSLCSSPRASRLPSGHVPTHWPSHTASGTASPTLDRHLRQLPFLMEHTPCTSASTATQQTSAISTAFAAPPSKRARNATAAPGIQQQYSASTEGQSLAIPLVVTDSWRSAEASYIKGPLVAEALAKDLSTNAGAPPHGQDTDNFRSSTLDCQESGSTGFRGVPLSQPLLEAPVLPM
eukprot:jgi/Botrbrau1/19429/Bobra.0338s0054.1